MHLRKAEAAWQWSYARKDGVTMKKFQCWPLRIPGPRRSMWFPFMAPQLYKGDQDEHSVPQLDFLQVPS